ncbi:hypothetical protein EDB85DRAFT_1962426 [Lactarius pseudohatsudake]|nr:hypothetical protein EDB85DRAFT_1962426 [Lactarius pseudohatsudake]
MRNRVCTRVDNTAKSSERMACNCFLNGTIIFLFYFHTLVPFRVGEVVNTARRLEATNAQAIFHKDVEDTYSHIVKRVEIDKQEVEAVTGGEEQISATTSPPRPTCQKALNQSIWYLRPEGPGTLLPLAREPFEMFRVLLSGKTFWCSRIPVSAHTLWPRGPPASQAGTGADGSVGGLGTRDTIKSRPHVDILQLHRRARLDTGSTYVIDLVLQLCPRRRQ